jgi:hypothetical protein
MNCGSYNGRVIIDMASKVAARVKKAEAKKKAAAK